MNIENLIPFIREIYQTNDFIPLHEPRFNHLEKENLIETIDSNFVSSVGKFVDQMEEKVRSFTQSERAIATVNGTAALHTCLFLSGVQRGDLVLTQALTFVATCNTLHHLGAEPVFIDISRTSLGLSPKAARLWLEENAILSNDGLCMHKKTQQKIKAILPMHTFGHPVELDELLQLSHEWNLTLIEDAAESLGSYYKSQHTGTLGRFGALSFNGNKIITTGGGGMILCRNKEDGEHAKHVTTTAKRPHPYEFFHDEPGFNYRMPNLNAALGCAQMEKLNHFLEQKRTLAQLYAEFFKNSDFEFVTEPQYAHSNYWLNAIICTDKAARNYILHYTNQNSVMTRPVWQLMHRLPMFSHCMRDNLENSIWAEEHLVNIPSSVQPLLNSK